MKSEHKHEPWRKSYMFIADMETDYCVYADKHHRVKGTALIVLNIIERMMEK